MTATKIWLSLALLALASTQALASKCYIREYGQMGVAQNGQPQIADEPPLVDQTALDFSGGHAESAAFGNTTKYIRVWCDAQASFLVGTAPVATNAMSPLTSATPEYFGVRSGQKISVVANP